MGKFIDRQPIHLRSRGPVASILIHAVIFALFYPWTLAGWLPEALDPDWLGIRGGHRWAETIGLTQPGGQSGSEDKALQAEGEVLRVEIVAMPSQGHDILARHKTEQDASAKRKKISTGELGKKTAKTKNSESKDSALPSAPAQAQADAARGKSAAQNPGRDIGGDQGIGGSDQTAAGQFVSGEEMKRVLSGWTLIGTNGFADGSIGRQHDKVRRAVNWRVYYHRDGYLQARFVKQTAATPHGDIASREFWSAGRWWIKENWLCQSIEKWFYGGETCFEVRRKGKQMALYYASCWGVSRCYEGRLGPRGFILQGKKLNAN